MLKWALEYQKKGMSVMPVQKNKKPYLKEWKSHQETIPTEDQVKSFWADHPEANIGIITGKISGITVIDLDSDNAYHEFQEKYLSDSIETPIAKTPNGYHFYFNYFKDAVSRRFADDMDCKSDGGYIIAPPSSNGKGGKYKWISKASKSNIPSSLKDIISSSLYVPREGELQQDTDIREATKIKDGKRDEVLFHIANHLIKGYMAEEEVQYYLTLIVKYCCEKGKSPYTPAEVNAKVKSAVKRAKDQERNIAQLVREWVLATGGTFSNTKSHNELQLATREEKRAANAELQRLEKTNILERYGNIRGQYRLIETDFNFEDFSSAASDTFEIDLPLGLSDYCETMPGDLIVFAGTPNAGKSTIMFDVIRRNMDRHPIYYFSSELNKYAIHKRLKKDMYIPVSDWKFKFSSDFQNIVDCVQPKGITILDYIEETGGEYYKIPSIMAQIHSKLKGGVCIAALQKHSKKEYGAGGELTLAKPNLYCTIDADYPYTKMVIRKCKNFATEENPNGFERRFKIVSGIKLITEGLWLPAMT